MSFTDQGIKSIKDWDKRIAATRERLAKSGGALVEVYLTPIGSFKIRGAANRLLQAGPSELAKGVWTASAGNMAQGVAYMARRLGIPCSVVVPDTAPATKRAAIERLGGRLVPVPHDEWFEGFRTRRYDGLDGVFVHAFSDAEGMAGERASRAAHPAHPPAADAPLLPRSPGR